jgi:broad specificity phosphatase PhoE
MEPRRLRANYVLLRHGFSVPNELGLIVSAPAQGLLPENGLTSVGIEQAKKAGKQLIGIVNSAQEFEGATRGGLDPCARILIVSSDFSRAYETACAASMAAGEGTCDVRVDVRLRERFFGAFDLSAASNYDVVWKHDLESDGSSAESVYSVANRVSAVVEEIEAGTDPDEYGLIVLSSHGDWLQICQAWMRGCPPHKHRSLPHLDNCELRCMFAR